MSASSPVSDDRLATVTACTDLDRPAHAKRSDIALSIPEWNQLARWLRDTDRRPADLLFSSIENGLVESGLDQRIVDKALSIPNRASDVLDKMIRLQDEAGIWTLCRADTLFPRRWKEKLRAAAPPVLFGAGNIRLMQTSSVSVVGSRYISAALGDIANELGRRIALSGLLLVSGAAKGADQHGMRGALESGGRSAGILPGDLERRLRQEDLRDHIARERLCLVSHVRPNVGFNAGNAMARNQFIYAQSDLTIVIACVEGSGGTWAGAEENIKKRIAPIAVWSGAEAPPANQKLVELGAYPLERLPEFEEIAELIRSAQENFSQRIN